MQRRARIRRLLTPRQCFGWIHKPFGPGLKRYLGNSNRLSRRESPRFRKPMIPKHLSSSDPTLTRQTSWQEEFLLKRLKLGQKVPSLLWLMVWWCPLLTGASPPHAQWLFSSVILYNVFVVLRQHNMSAVLLYENAVWFHSGWPESVRRVSLRSSLFRFLSSKRD